MTLHEYLSAGLVDEPIYNCAEKMLRGADAAYGLNLDPKLFTMAAPFGGGMAVGKTCGAITGAMLVLAAMFVREREKESGTIKRLTKELMERCADQLHDTDCVALKQRYFNPQTRCRSIILDVAAILDDIIERELHKSSV